MDNLYEILILEEPVRCDREKAPLSKFEEATPKNEKLSSQDLPSFTCVKYTDSHKSPEGSRTNGDKQRLRQYVQSRTEMLVVDNNPISIKKNSEIRENERSGISKVPFLPLLSIRTNAIEEIYKEIKEIKQNITELEEINKVNLHCIEIGKVKIQDLEDRHSALRKKAGLGCTYEERKEELLSKLKQGQKTWKKSSKKLKTRIQELEEEAKELSSKADALKNKIFRKGEQQKILKKDLNDSGTRSLYNFLCEK